MAPLRRNYIQKTTGKKVKGVTTHLSVLNKPALMWWAYKQGLDNYERLSADIAQMGQKIDDMKDFEIKEWLVDILTTFPVLGLYDKRDQAAEAGTLAHEMIENHLRGLPETQAVGSPEVIQKAKGCYKTFLQWEKSQQLKVWKSEVALTSEKHPYGGTIDHVIDTAMTPNGKVDVLDIKTGKDIYDEAFYQVASYGALWNEHHPEMLVAGYHILRLGPEGEFTHKYSPWLDPGYFEIFFHAMQIKEIKDRLGIK